MTTGAPMNRLLLCAVAVLLVAGDKPKKIAVPLEEIYALLEEWSEKEKEARERANDLQVQAAQAGLRKALRNYAGVNVKTKAEVASVSINRAAYVVAIYPEGRKPVIPEHQRQMQIKDGVVTGQVQILTTDKKWAQGLKAGDDIEIEGKIVFTTNTFGSYRNWDAVVTGKRNLTGPEWTFYIVKKEPGR
jgi:hypothetical protein